VLTRIQLIILLITSFLPPIIYTIWIRNTERYHRERWYAIAICFLWGASIAIIAALILEIFLDLGLSVSFIQESPPLIKIIAVLMIAPFAEELVKPLALKTRTVYRELKEFEDGLIYGAIAGLGFSATENLLYGFSFLQEGLSYFFILMTIRSIGGCLLHASATALTGYGYGKALLTKKSSIRIIPYFLAAMIMHASYNFLVSWEEIGIVTGLGLAFIIVIFSIRFIRKKIRTLDQS
jgi:RsiW-degrading membrane proteinase PrsW (M82 family)